jgi:hypothetical protein
MNMATMIKGHGNRNRWLALVTAVATVAAVGSWLHSASRAAPSRVVAPAPASDVSWYGAGGSDASARFERTLLADGREQLRGTTRYAIGDSASWIAASELAELNANGGLQQAEVRLSYGNPAWAKHARLPAFIAFDAKLGQVTSLRLDGASESRRVASDLAWIYQPISLPGGKSLTTPVAAFVAQRAVRTASVLRLIDQGRADPSVLADQVTVADGGVEWLVLGDDLASFSAAPSSELLALRVAALGFELKPCGPARLL